MPDILVAKTRKTKTGKRQCITSYVPGSGIKVVDRNNGMLKVVFEGECEEYTIYTRPFKGCVTKKYDDKFLGRYAKIYIEDDEWMENVVACIAGWP
jgi:hypothetical protein